ncbi:hypothetical protein SETIT_4G002400v2 [Setaria italica]|uniref:Uncharacterized protein n=1 Tax=Setaria italica TaxID=4555 RepID=A0A368QP74_SETIT|nr:hypothetical protein SETIT_4G002400v2 [Setaria italica]
MLDGFLRLVIKRSLQGCSRRHFSNLSAIQHWFKRASQRKILQRNGAQHFHNFFQKLGCHFITHYCFYCYREHHPTLGQHLGCDGSVFGNHRAQPSKGHEYRGLHIGLVDSPLASILGKCYH